MNPAERVYVAFGFLLVGAGLVIATVAWLRDRLPPHDPHAVPFGEMPRVPDAAEEAERLWS